ncbi:MAG: DUF695 domain-containing protein [Acidimicrobiia bacterium]|nr:DUF695 domain-containing protein [Acidimicrobiia bacterium]
MFQDAIEEFWEWWAEVRTEVATQVRDGALSDDLIDDIGDRVWRIHPELEWQLTGGIDATNSLNLVSGGTRLLRLIAELWRRMGPAADAEWEHHPARLPFGLTPFEMGGTEIDPSEGRFTAKWDELYERLDLTISHPAFVELTDDEARDAAIHLLDGTLGEDAVERWMGILETSTDAGAGSPLFTLRSDIDGMAAAATGESWQRADDQYDGVVVARVNRAVKWIDHISKPIYGELTITALASDDDGLPVPLEQKRIDASVAALGAALGDHAVFIGMATGEGEHTVHFFCEPGDAVEEALRVWREQEDNRDITIELIPDEQWTNAEQWD